MTARATFVTSTLAFGGAERVWSVLLPELAARGFVVRAVTLRDEGAFFDELRAKGIDVRCVHMRSRADLLALRRAFHVLDGGTDVVVSQSVNAQVTGALMARRAGVPHVTIDHAGPGLPQRLHRRLLMRAVAPTVDVLVAVSAAQLPRLLPLGYRPDRIEIIPNAVEPLVPAHDRTETRRLLGLGEDDVAALLVADMRPVKNPTAFVAAVARARERDPRVRGVIAGGGPEFVAVQAAAAQTDGAVQVLGARADVADLMNAADVVCLTSRTEGQPMTMLEAMSIGRPVVATAVGGIPELVADGETGVLVPAGDTDAFADALLRLSADPGLRNRLGEAGLRRHRERFGVDRMVSAYAETLSRVIERGRRRG